VIDLHTHTNESDGSLTPAELVDLAVSLKLEALAITDHDTFAGYDLAVPRAAEKGLDLVCGIELSARFDPGRRTVHLLGYFLHGAPSVEFRAWLDEVLASRRERNVRLVEKLKSMGIDIELAEAERVGRTLTGRPHFARVLVQKSYARTNEEAFRKYLGESAPGYVERESPDAADAIRRVLAAGGLSVVAHPVRLGIRDPIAEEKFIVALRAAGLGGLEVYHSDHGPADVERYAAHAAKHGLAVTGGSDFHGEAKPQIALGTGRGGNLNIPRSVLENLISRR
jgi:predicted metal-dependent phosphoesterase TrpH